HKERFEVLYATLGEIDSFQKPEERSDNFLVRRSDAKDALGSRDSFSGFALGNKNLSTGQVRLGGFFQLARLLQGAGQLKPAGGAFRIEFADLFIGINSLVMLTCIKQLTRFDPVIPFRIHQITELYIQTCNSDQGLTVMGTELQNLLVG